jgi:hypothetical protein
MAFRNLLNQDTAVPVINTMAIIKARSSKWKRFNGVGHLCVEQGILSNLLFIRCGKKHITKR